MATLTQTPQTPQQSTQISSEQQQQQQQQQQIQQQIQQANLERQKIWTENHKSAIDAMSQALLTSVGVPIEHLSQQLKELDHAQKELLKTLDMERQKLESIPELQYVGQTVII